MWITFHIFKRQSSLYYSTDVNFGKTLRKFHEQQFYITSVSLPLFIPEKHPKNQQKLLVNCTYEAIVGEARGVDVMGLPRIQDHITNIFQLRNRL